MLASTHRFAVVFIAVSLLGCATNHKVTRVSSGDASRFRDTKAFYALPRTAVTVEAELLRQDYVAGHCGHARAIAEELDIDLDTLKTTAGVRFAVNSLKLANRAEPDPDNIFAVDVEPRFLQKRSQLLELSEQGLILTATTEAQSQALEVGAKFLEFGAGIAGKVMKFGGAAETSRCEEISGRIRDLRSSQTRLIEGQPGQAFSKETLEFMMAELRKQEAILLSEFTGRTKKATLATLRCTYVPAARYDRLSQPTGANDSQPRPLFSYSKTEGFRLDTDSSCEPLPSVFVAPTGVETKESVTLRIQHLETPFADAVAARQRKPKTSGGLFYRVPGAARVQVLEGTAVKQEAAIAVAQYGVVTSLPGPTYRAFSTKYEAKLHGDLGALKSLATSSTSVDTASLGAAGAALQPLADGLLEREKAEKAAKDPLAQLGRERALLEEQAHIDCLKAGGYPNCD